MTILKLGENVKKVISDINSNFSELVNKLTYQPVSYKILFNGSVSIPSNESGEYSTITLSDNVTQFDGIIIQREGAGDWQRMQSISVGSKFKVINNEADFDFMEGCNLYMCNVEVLSSTQLKVSNNVYAGVKTTAAGRYLTGFDERPITRIIGIKLNA